MSMVRRVGKRLADAVFAPLVRRYLEPLITRTQAQAQATREHQLRNLQSTLGRDIAALRERLEPALAAVVAQAGLAEHHRIRGAQAALRAEIATLREHIARQTPGNPCIHGFKAYAQTDEDGIVEHILGRLPSHSRTFIEIGCGSGVENNTHYLALKGYRGCWVDGSDGNIGKINEALGGLAFSDLLIEKQFVSVENVGELVTRYCEFLGTQQPAFFSLDIDGNDLHVMREAIKHVRPWLVCVEYNPKFPPPLSITIPYDPEHTWSGGDYHGASLQAFCDLLTGYKLVACNLTGANAFFVRRDLSRGFRDYTPKQLYQPFRENLIDLRSEHAPTLRWLRDRLAREADAPASRGNTATTAPKRRKKTR